MPQQQDWFSQNAPKPAGQDWFAQNAPQGAATPPPPAPGFLESVGNAAGKVLGSQIDSYKHGGGAVGSGQVGPHGEVPDTFNPLHPIATAGYLVPQPIKNLVQHPSAQTAGELVGQALPYATSPMGAIERPGEVASAPIRGVVKAGNAVLDNPTVQKAAPAAGAMGGYAAGHMVGLPWWVNSAVGGVGAKLGKAVQEGARIPGERLGLPAEPPATPSPISSTVTAPRTNAPVQGEGGPLSSTRPEVVPPTPKPVPISEGGVLSSGNSSVAKVPSGPVPPPVRTEPIARASEPEPVAPPKVSVSDQIATAKGLGFKNLGEAINRFGFEGWQKILGQEQPATEPPSVRPGSPTPFHSDAPLTPADLGRIRNTNIPTWEDVERQGAKERFYAEAPQVKTKAQLVNEVQPSMVAKSQANTSPYTDNLPTRKIRK